MFVCVVLLFLILNGRVGVKNELGFVWVGGVVRFIFSTLAFCLAITWPLDLQIE